MKSAKLCALLFVATICPLYAADAPIASPGFLFSEDAKVGQTIEQFKSGIERKSLIREDKWLNAPLTRLDYVLLNIQMQLNAFLPETVMSFIKDNFDRTDSYGDVPYLPSPEVEFSARYSDELGRLVLRAHVVNLGRPNKPMKESCETILGFMERSYPLNPFGYSWQNGALDLLMRADADEYVSVVKKLSASVVLMTHLTATYRKDGRNAFFSFGCRKQKDGGQIVFYKYSSFLRSIN